MTELPTPPAHLMRDREAAFAEVGRRLGPWLRPGGLRVSPLGAGYSSDVDAYVTSEPDPAVMHEAGWLLLDDLVGALGLREHGRWAVVVDARVVGAADIYTTPPPDPVGHILERCRRRGAGPRELAELEVLREQGHEVGPVPHRRPSARPRAVVGSLRRAVRPRLVVAISGVDGAGKTTLAERLVEDLTKAGVPATRVWARPGATVAGLVDRLARRVKRLLREDPGLLRAAAGDAATVRSRQGFLGRLWGSLLLVNFAVEVWRQYARAHGVVVFDRHRLDAEVTLQVLYPGQERSLAWRLVSRVLPEPDVRLHLDVPWEVAAGRKPGDMIGAWAVQRQSEEYERLTEADAVRLDGQEHPDRLALLALRELVRGGRR